MAKKRESAKKQVVAKKIRIDKIVVDAAIQARARMCCEAVSRYAEDIERGVTMPPLDVFEVDGQYLLADGFHRHEALASRCKKDSLCIVHQGTRIDAILFAAGSNTKHGLPRTNEDKRRAVNLVLDNTARRPREDSQIAKRCGVSHTYVANLKAERKAQENCNVAIDGTGKTDVNAPEYNTVAADDLMSVPMGGVAVATDPPAAEEEPNYSAAFDAFDDQGPATLRKAGEEPGSTVAVKPDDVKASAGPKSAKVQAELAGTATKKPGGAKAKGSTPAEVTATIDARKVKDGKGDPVPNVPGLRDVFADRTVQEQVDLVDNWLEIISPEAVCRAIQAKSRFLPWVREGDLARYAEEIREGLVKFLETLTAGVPYAPCQMCGGASCKECRNSGYVPLWRYRELMERATVAV